MHIVTILTFPLPNRTRSTECAYSVIHQELWLHFLPMIINLSVFSYSSDKSAYVFSSHSKYI